MDATISLDRSNLWQMIQALSLNADNKLWLGQKLIEEAKKEKSQSVSASKFYGVWEDGDSPDADELAREIKASRRFKDDIIAF